MRLAGSRLPMLWSDLISMTTPLCRFDRRDFRLLVREVASRDNRLGKTWHMQDASGRRTSAATRSTWVRHGA